MVTFPSCRPAKIRRGVRLRLVFRCPNREWFTMIGPSQLLSCSFPRRTRADWTRSSARVQARSASPGSPAALAIGSIFVAMQLFLRPGRGPLLVDLPFLFLGVALLIAQGFEFVNGFHDTANAVATVIYTNSLQPNLAVVWSGFHGTSSAGSPCRARWPTASSSLLPVELILQVGGAPRLRHGVRPPHRRHRLEPGYPGTSVSPRRARTPSSARSSASGSPIS